MPPPLPTLESVVAASAGDTVVCLWRGTRPQTAQRIVQYRTAGGYDTSATPGLTPSAPTNEQAVAQVAGASGANFGANDRLPEYTTNQAIARQFSSGAIVIIAIRRKFLIKGSVSEDGWIVYPEAPLENAGWVDHTTQERPKLISSATGKHISGD